MNIEENLISVILPVYNVEMYLSTCLDSILSQSYRNLEIIIINDGSSDFSLKIAQAYSEKDDRVIVYSHENEGQSEARNRGLSVATGDYVTFVDADDILLPDAIKIMHDVIVRMKADIVEGDFIKGNILKESYYNKTYKSISFNPAQAISDVLYQKKLSASIWGKLFKRSLFENLNFKKGIIYEDLDIICKLFDKSTKIIRIDFPVYFYRIREGSSINEWHPRRLDVLTVTENIENYISEKYPDLLPAAKDRRLSANFNMFALCNINGEKENANMCWKHIKKNRKPALFNSNVRFKNKAGVLLSYLGKNMFYSISKIIYSK